MVAETMPHTSGQFTPPHPLTTPVLFLIFNRPDTTRQVFEAIRQARPPRLYVAADGYRKSPKEDSKLIDETRVIATAVDWPCELKTFYRDENLGCGPAVKQAIDWFFDCEDNGIILEDDTVPSQSFFWFCSILLNYYSTDQRIGMIAGVNHLGYKPKFGSYIFSKNKACWGWATWRRAWEKMDFYMNWCSAEQAHHVIHNMGSSSHYESHWLKSIKLIHERRVNAWDWQWYFTLATQNQLTIFPPENLVSNIGFGKNATHTHGRAPVEILKRKDVIFPLVHPNFVLPDYEWDIAFEQRLMKINWIRKFIARMIPASMKKIIRKFLY